MEELNTLVGYWSWKPSEAKIRKRIEKHIEEGSFYAVYSNDQLISALAVKKNKSGSEEIAGFAVAESLRGKGLGKAILMKAEYEIFNSAVVRVETDDNAVQFYRNCGFLIEKTKTLDNGISRYTLRKERIPMDEISTDRLALLPVTKEMQEAVFHIYSHQEVCRFYDISPFTRRDQALKHMNRWIEMRSKGLQVRFMIQYEKQIVGSCGLYLINKTHRRACLGYDLLPQFQGRGLGSEAVEALLSHMVPYYHLNRIQAEVLPQNQASKKLLEKLGFEKEGLLRQYENWGEKGLVDLEIYAKLFRSDRVVVD